MTKLRQEIAEKLIDRMRKDGGSIDWRKFNKLFKFDTDETAYVVKTLWRWAKITQHENGRESSIKLTEKGWNFTGFHAKILKKKIFVSYSDTDRNKMRILQEIINKTTLFDPEIIADKRESLKSLAEKVKTGIFESDYIVPIITKDSISSQWVNQEIGYAIAMNKEIFPILDLSIIDQLKGFIHKNIDLPYNFFQDTSKRASNNAFRKICVQLVNDLLRKNNHLPLTLNIQYLFSGLWKSTYTAPHLDGIGTEDVEIKGKNYYSNGIYRFNVNNFRLSDDKTKVSFIKVDIKKRKRKLRNDLIITKLGEVYLGTEFDEQGRPISITYSKV